MIANFINLLNFTLLMGDEDSYDALKKRLLLKAYLCLLALYLILKTT